MQFYDADSQKLLQRWCESQYVIPRPIAIDNQSQYNPILQDQRSQP